MEHIDAHIPFIGEKAPEFCAASTQGEIKFPQDYHGKWVVLFSCEADFSPVCSTELMMFGAMVDEFKEINTQLIGLSPDSVNSHIAWLRKLKELAWKDIKHIDICFPVIADPMLTAAGRYGMIEQGSSCPRMVRAVYIISPEGIIRAILFYPVSVGRNIAEIKRMLCAIQKSDREKAATPVNWIPNEDILLMPPKSCKEAAERLETVTGSTYCLDWFLCFRQADSQCDNPGKEPESNPYPSAYPQRYRQGSRR